MAEETLHVESRTPDGTRGARRLRAAGKIPAILYGHGEQCVNLTIRADEMAAVIRHGNRFVDLQGDLKEKALIREIQFDTFGVEVLHCDLTRVSAKERIQVTVPIHLRGDAPGSHEGGVVDHSVHEVVIECPAAQIPGHLDLSVKNLHLGGSLTAADIQLPEGFSLLIPMDTVVVTCHEPAAEVEAGEAGQGEPEVIGQKDKENADAEE